MTDNTLAGRRRRAEAMSRAEQRPRALLARHLRARLSELQMTRHELEERIQGTPLSEHTVRSALIGRSGVPPKHIPYLADALSQGDSKAKTELEALLSSALKEDASRAAAARTNVAPLRVGYLETPPFSYRDSGGNPKGLFPDLLGLMFRLLRVEVRWHYLKFREFLSALEQDTVDLVAGLALETVRRRARATFATLDLPFAAGVNAVSRAPDFIGGQSYEAMLSVLLREESGSDPLRVVVVEDELADDYLPALLPNTVRVHREPNLSIAETLREYGQRKTEVILAGQDLCEAAVRTARQNGDEGLKLLLKEPIGRFPAGFFLPAHDPEWAAFVGDAFMNLMSARLPIVGRVFLEHRAELEPLLVIERRVPQALRGIQEPTVMEVLSMAPKRYPTLNAWLRWYWPIELEPPWIDRLSVASDDSPLVSDG